MALCYMYCVLTFQSQSLAKSGHKTRSSNHTSSPDKATRSPAKTLSMSPDKVARSPVKTPASQSPDKAMRSPDKSSRPLISRDKTRVGAAGSRPVVLTTTHRNQEYTLISTSSHEIFRRFRVDILNLVRLCVDQQCGETGRQ